MRNGEYLDIPDRTGTGVYVITNTTNGKMYIGSTRRIRERLLCHRSAMKTMKCNDKFKQDVKAGHHFEAKVLESMPPDISDDGLIASERKYINQYGTCNNGYNIQFTYENPTAKALAWNNEKASKMYWAIRNDEEINKSVIQKAANALDMSVASFILAALELHIANKLGNDWVEQG